MYYCYDQGYGAGILLPMLGLVIDCMGIVFFNDTDHFYYFPELKYLHSVFLEIQESLLMWGNIPPQTIDVLLVQRGLCI